jgi:hypothetical protein
MPVSKSKRKGKRKKSGEGSKSLPKEQAITLDIDALGGFPGYERMSEVLRDFAEPLAEFASSEGDYKALYGVATLAWNMALFTREEREQLLRDMTRQGMPPMPKEAKLLINELIHRKKTYFAEYERMIINFQVTKIPDGVYLRVVSTLV